MDYMTIQEVLNELEKIPENERHLLLYVCDENGENIPVKHVSLFDNENKHNENNPLGLDY